MNGGNVMWLPKSACPIRENFVTIPLWLQKQIIKGQAKKEERKMKQLEFNLV